MSVVTTGLGSAARVETACAKPWLRSDSQANPGPGDRAGDRGDGDDRAPRHGLEGHRGDDGEGSPEHNS